MKLARMIGISFIVVLATNITQGKEDQHSHATRVMGTPMSHGTTHQNRNNSFRGRHPHQNQVGFFPYYPVYYYPVNPYSDVDNNYYSSGSDNNYAPSTWVDVSDNQIPGNATVYQRDENNNPIYYCRGTLNNQLYYGKASQDTGCIISSGAVSIRFVEFQVLVQ